MIHLESMPILIYTQRQSLYDLFDPRALPDLTPSRRERLGAQIVRVGHWVANHCPEVAAVSPTGDQPSLARS